MSLQELAMEAIARASAATKGPWEPNHDEDRVRTSYITSVGIDHDGVTPWQERDTIADVPNEADREFIAHAREDVEVLAQGVISLSNHVDTLKAILRRVLPQCDQCGALATREYHHVSGHRMVACDDDRCLEENFCDECGQVWYGNNPKCDAIKDGGVPCTGTTKHPERTAHFIREIPHSVAIRTLR